MLWSAVSSLSVSSETNSSHILEMALKTSKETAGLMLMVFSLLMALATGAMLGLLLTGTASAQDTTPPDGEDIPEDPRGEETSTTEETPEPEETRGEQIEPGLTVRSTYLSEEGEVKLTFESDIARSVTLTDAGAVREGGEVPRRTVILEPGESTVRFPVTEVDGLAAVTIGTSSVLYSVVLEDTSGLLDVPAPSDRAALLIGIALPPVLGYLWVRRRRSLDDSGIVRVE